MGYPKKNANARKLHHVLSIFLLITSISAQLQPTIRTPLQTLRPDLFLPKAVGPGVDRDTCGGYWFKTGFVCDKAKTQAYAAEDNRRMLQEERFFNSTIDKMVSAILRTRVERQKKFPSNWMQGLSNYQMIFTNSNTIKWISSTCWTLMRSIRTSSLCTTCSAENFKSYIGQRLCMTQADCSGFIDTCSGRASLIAALTHITHIIVVDFPQVLRETARSSNWDHIHKYEAQFGANSPEYKNVAEMTRLAWRSGWHEDHGNTLLADKLEAEFCEKMVSIYREPILYKQTLYISQAIDAFLSAYNSQFPPTGALAIPSQPTRALTFEALLSASASRTDIFEPEVVVLMSLNPETHGSQIAIDHNGRKEGFNSSLRFLF